MDFVSVFSNGVADLYHDFDCTGTERLIAANLWLSGYSYFGHFLGALFIALNRYTAVCHATAHKTVCF